MLPSFFVSIPYGFKFLVLVYYENFELLFSIELKNTNWSIILLDNRVFIRN